MAVTLRVVVRADLRGLRGKRGRNGTIGEARIHQAAAVRNLFHEFDSCVWRRSFKWTTRAGWRSCGDHRCNLGA